MLDAATAGQTRRRRAAGTRSLPSSGAGAGGAGTPSSRLATLGTCPCTLSHGCPISAPWVNPLCHQCFVLAPFF